MSVGLNSLSFNFKCVWKKIPGAGGARHQKPNKRDVPVKNTHILIWKPFVFQQR